MVSVAELRVTIGADITDLDKGLTTADKRVSGFDKTLGGVKAGIGGLVSGFGSLGLAAAGVGAAIEGVKSVGNLFGLGALNEMEQTRASFNAFTKDAALTEQIMADVRTEAAKTPFAFGEMAKATASLMPVAKSSGAALMDLVKEAEILAASNPLEGLEGASFSLREAMTGDFTSIIERFNLSRTTINKLKEEGVPNLEIVRRAMQEMGFDSDLIAAKAETLDGRWSTFMDTLETLQTRMGQPIFDAMKGGLVSLQGVLDNNMGMFEEWADTVAAGLTTTIKLTKELVGVFMGGEFDAAREMLDQLLPKQVVDGILVAIDSLGIAFDGLFRGDLPSLIEGAKGVISGFGDIIVGFVEDWAGTIAGWVDGANPELMSNLGDLWTDFADWLQDSGIKIVEKLGQWAGAFVDWIGPKIPDILRELGAFLVKVTTWIITDALPTMVAKLAEWGLAFVEWVAPRIPPLLLELGKLLLELGGWIITTALPAILSKLAEWATAFVAWVAPQIPKLLLELGLLELKLIAWIGEQVAGIGVALLAWSLEFLAWISRDVVPKLPEKLGAILTAIDGWVADRASDFAQAVKRLGSGMVQGIQDGVSGALGGFWSWLQSNFVDRIPSFVRELLDINSPSGVFAGIGRNIVDGLRVGMEARLPSIDEVIRRVVGNLTAVSGDVMGWLSGAMALTQTGPDWLAGLSRLVHLESTGNPRAINPTSVGGEHATGLLQTLPSTFRSFALPGMGDIFNPIHNAAAAIRYIKATYGHVNNIPGLYGNFGGYASGGWAGLGGPELAWLGERGPEYVVPNHALRGAAPLGGNTYVIDARGAQVYDGTRFVEILVSTLEQAERGGRIVKVTR